MDYAKGGLANQVEGKGGLSKWFCYQVESGFADTPSKVARFISVTFRCGIHVEGSLD